MRTWRWLTAAVMVAALGGSARGDETPADAQDLLVVRPGGSALKFRVRITVDGQPFRVLWERDFKNLWKEVDRNGDGGLDEEEKRGLPWPAPFGKIDEKQFFDLCERLSPPVDIKATPLRARSSSGLFTLLDASRDGRLEKSELSAAGKLIAIRDFNDDGMLTPEELLPPYVPGKPSGTLVLGLQRNGKLSPELRTEYARLLEATPDLEATPVSADLRIALGKKKFSDAVGGEAKASGVTVRASGRSGVAVELEDLRIDVQSIEPRASQQQPASSGMPSFLELDTDKNDYLTATELKAVVEEKAFALLDADRDKKVSSAEYNRFVGRRLRLRKASLTMGVTDLGQELFGSLDADSDGRLTRFELAAAAKLLERHKASMLGGKELPRSLTLEVTRGDLPQMGMMMRPNMMNMARTAKETPPAGPEWFKAMDANGDGLVDRGEFLGSAAQFAATDGDKDGFLSPAEAGKVKVAAKSQ